MARIYLNEDTNHYFIKRGEKSSDLNEIKDFIYQYKDSNVDVIILNPNSQLLSYKSDVWNCIAERITEYKEYLEENPIMRKWAYAIRDLEEKNIDIYSLWIKHIREIGKTSYISMRMNDIHNANDVNNIMHSDFYKNNLNYRRAMYRDSCGEDRQLDYAIKDVYDYHMKLVVEYFSKFDFDGIELDWMRFGNHFATGYADEGRKILNDFMYEVRCLADKYEKIRGHKISVGARVPSKADTAFDLGMDAIYWAKNGYVDFIVPSPFWQTSQADIPIEMWKYYLDGTECKILPCFEVGLRPYLNNEYKSEFPYNSLETLTGPSCSFLDRGADGIYFFNYMDKEDFMYNDEEYKKIIEIIGDYDKMKKLSKRYIVTFNDRKADGNWLDIMLPKKLEKGVFTEYRVHIGNMKEIKDKYIISSFQNNKSVTDKDIMIYVNGHKCKFIGQHKYKKSYPENPLYKWEVPEIAFKNGYQVIEYVSKIDDLVLDWVEMLVL